jgi:hypothetical protein
MNNQGSIPIQLLENEEWIEYGGFIDGTMGAICRPVENQRPYYTGYKCFHAVKY